MYMRNLQNKYFNRFLFLRQWLRITSTQNDCDKLICLVLFTPKTVPDRIITVRSPWAAVVQLEPEDQTLVFDDVRSERLLHTNNNGKFGKYTLGEGL